MSSADAASYEVEQIIAGYGIIATTLGVGCMAVSKLSHNTPLENTGQSLGVLGIAAAMTAIGARRERINESSSIKATIHPHVVASRIGKPENDFFFDIFKHSTEVF